MPSESRSGLRTWTFWARFCAFCLAALVAAAQQAAPQTANPPPATAPTAEFLQAADEVLAEMSKLLSLSVVSPLKKSVRTREEIRDYVLRKMKEDREPEKRYADQKALEKFGLIPKGFPLDAFLVDLLTEQIAGLYDPKSQEFFIADWISPPEQRLVMAHELTHALQDQHFRIEAWVDAAKPNDDAELARDAVLEGSALAAMVDYLLRDQPKGIRDLGEIDPTQLLGEEEKSPQFAKAPPFVRDTLLFPYLAGTRFTQSVLRASNGWGDFRKVFEKPPASTQQILHPELYLSGSVPAPVRLPPLSSILATPWKKLDENVLGEFGLRGVLKQFLGEARASRLASAWAGDRYAIFENQKSKQLVLVLRLRLAAESDAARFLGSYSEALELKYGRRRNLLRRPGFFSFESGEGGVFLRCVVDQCLSIEGTTRAAFDRILRGMGWPAAPAAPPRRTPTQRTALTTAASKPSSLPPQRSAFLLGTPQTQPTVHGR